MTRSWGTRTRASSLCRQAGRALCGLYRAALPRRNADECICFVVALEEEGGPISPPCLPIICHPLPDPPAGRAGDHPLCAARALRDWGLWLVSGGPPACQLRREQAGGRQAGRGRVGGTMRARGGVGRGGQGGGWLAGSSSARRLAGRCIPCIPLALDSASSALFLPRRRCCLQAFVNEQGGRHKFFNVWPYIRPLRAWIK